MKHRVKNKTSNRLQQQLILLTLAITLGIGVLFSCFCTSVYHIYMENSLIHSTNTNLNFLTDSIDANLESVMKLIRWTQTNNTIGNYISVPNDNRYPTTAVAAHDRLTEECQNNSANPYLHRVVISNKSGRYIQVVAASYSSNQNLAARIPELPYFNTLFETKGYDLSIGFSEDPFYHNEQLQVIPIVRPIYAQYNSDKIGWIFLQITDSLFCDPLAYYSCPEDAELFLLLGEHTYRMTPDGIEPYTMELSLSEDTMLTNTDLKGDSRAYTIRDENGEETILVVRKLEQDNCYIAQTLSTQELKSQYHMLFLLWVVILALMLIIGLLLTYALHHLIAIPVHRIRGQIARVSSGDFTPDNSIEWNHELGDIGRGINTLASDIEQLMEKRISDEKEKKDLEYKVLQSQINPHFLYNTLNSIKWMASIQGATGIADMTTSLSRLLRSISKGTQLLIPLSEELSLVRDYFTIQQYRYGGTIQLEIDCKDEHLLTYSIIKFTLQPIVENAIFHGIEPKGSGLIRIYIREEPFSHGKDLEIIIWDNGVGILPEKIDSLLQSNSESSPEFFREIGISNVHKRLQYEYGEHYGIHIKSVVGEYTSMHVVIPKKGED